MGSQTLIWLYVQRRLGRIIKLRPLQLQVAQPALLLLPQQTNTPVLLGLMQHLYLHMITTPRRLPIASWATTSTTTTSTAQAGVNHFSDS